jgi:tRNA A-37 threonylcarbamoyl transferase component Bud32
MDAAYHTATAVARLPHSCPPPRVERVAKGWAKRAEPEAKNHWRLVLRCTTALVPWPLLRSTATSGDCDSVQEEAARLRRWRAAGLPVPELVEAEDGYFITADAGQSLRSWLRVEADPTRRLQATKLAARALGQLHRLGYCHGRPFLKDIVYDGRQVTFVDLEEEPTQVMPLATAQVRDLMLFVMSCTASLGEQHARADLQRIAAAYWEMNPSARLRTVLRRNLRAIWWAALPLRLCPQRWLGRDGRQVVRGLAVLRRLVR